MVWSEGSAKRQTNQRSRRAIQVGVLEMLRMLIIQNLYKEKQPFQKKKRVTQFAIVQTTSLLKKKTTSCPNPRATARPRQRHKKALSRGGTEN